MKIALVSAPVRNRDIPFNVQSIIGSIARLSGKADVLLFGETALQGFDCLCWNYEEDKHRAFTLEDNSIEQIRDAARTFKTAVSFGFIERWENALYSSQVFIGANGGIVTVFRRVSRGWKDYTQTDSHYREGIHFEKFRYGGKTFAIGLCGDLWEDGRPEEMRALDASVVLWPIWCDYSAADWNAGIKYEYAAQAALCGDCILLVNPFCIDQAEIELASGGAAWFAGGKIRKELPAGESGQLIVEV